MFTDRFVSSREKCPREGAGETPVQFANVLVDFMQLGPFPVSVGLLSRMSGVPKATIVNWKTGRILRPRRWQDVVAVANALRLCVGTANTLLRAAGHNPLELLFIDAPERDRPLFLFWQPQAETLI